MYKRKFVFVNVQQYDIDEQKKHIIINKTDKSIEVYDFNTFNLIWQTDKYFDIQKFREDIIILVSLQHGCVYTNIQNGETNLEINEKFKEYTFFDFKELLGTYIKYSSEEELLGIYDFKDNKKLWEIKNKPVTSQILSVEYFLQWYISGELGILSTQTGETIWQISISEIGSLNDGSIPNGIRRSLGLLMNVLVLHVSSDNKDRLIGLDVQTGKLLWELADYEFEGIYYSYLPCDIFRVHANAESTRLISINRGFIEINPSNGEVLTYTPISPLDAQGKFSEYNGIGFIPYDGKAQGKYIYFSACRRTADGRAAVLPSSIGVYNMELQQVEWLHIIQEILDGKGGGALISDLSPIVDGNYLYASDMGNNFYIFEKEETQ